MRDNETMCAHDDAGPYHQHTKKGKKKKRKKENDDDDNNNNNKKKIHVQHLHTTFLIMDNLGYEDRRQKVSEFVFILVCIEAGYHYQ